MIKISNSNFLSHIHTSHEESNYTVASIEAETRGLAVELKVSNGLTPLDLTSWATHANCVAPLTKTGQCQRKRCIATDSLACHGFSCFFERLRIETHYSAMALSPEAGMAVRGFQCN